MNPRVLAPLVLLFSFVCNASSTSPSNEQGEVTKGRRLTTDSVSPAVFATAMDIGETDIVDKTVIIGEAVTTAKVDVFFLCDSTGSMYGLISSVKASAGSILAATSAFGDVAYGVGEYRDIYDVFTYRKNQAITTNTAAVQNGINQWSAGGGGDWPEANLFALHQVADTSSWRPDSKRILVWFGDAPGHDPRAGINEADAISALQAEDIVVQALDMRRLNAYGQAGRITAATGGTLYTGVSTSDIVNEILTAIGDVFATYSSVALQLPSLPSVSVTTVPSAYTGTYSRDTTEVFTFQVTFECLSEGVHSFEIPVLVDGGLVSTETDTITCYPANDPPIAVCQDVTVLAAAPDYLADANVNDGSYDPDGDLISLSQDPSGLYGIGDTAVTLTVSDGEHTDSCVGIVTVETAPVALCQDVTVLAAAPDYLADADVNDGSHDPDGDPISLSQDPPGLYGIGDTAVTLTVSDGEHTDSCVGIVTVETAPVALCEDRRVPAVGPNCNAEAEVDNGSYDPDGDDITLTQNPAGPYDLGDTTVTLTASDGTLTDSCTAVVTVTDDEPLEGTLVDPGPGVITPCMVEDGLLYTPSYAEKENKCGVIVSVDAESYGCSFCNGAGKTIDKLEGGSCILDVTEDEFLILDSGGVGDHLWFKTEVCNEGTTDCIDQTCTICVENGGCNNLRILGPKPKKGKGPFECPAGWDPLVNEFECV